VASQGGKPESVVVVGGAAAPFALHACESAVGRGDEYDAASRLEKAAA